MERRIEVERCTKDLHEMERRLKVLLEMERRIEDVKMRRNKTMLLYQSGNATAYDEFVNTMPVLKV